MAKALCRQAFELGKDPRAPHLHYTRFLEEDSHGREGRAFGLLWLRECDRLWLCGSAPKSQGMMAELSLAIELGMPIDEVSVELDILHRGDHDDVAGLVADHLREEP